MNADPTDRKGRSMAASIPQPLSAIEHVCLRDCEHIWVSIALTPTDAR